MKITANMLRELDARERQIEVFIIEWPNGAVVTLKNCVRALELGLDLDWIVEKNLSTPIQATYAHDMGLAWNRYSSGSRLALAEYDRTVDLAPNGYSSAATTGSTECESAAGKYARTTFLLQTNRNLAYAQAFYDA